MRKMTVRLLLVLAFITEQSFALVPNNDDPQNHVPFREGRILIKTHVDSPEDALAATAGALGAIPTRHYSIVPGLLLYEFDDSVVVAEAVSAFLNNEHVDYAEPDYYYHTTAVPNDSSFPQQWALENTGQTGGVIDADINADSMWALETGNPLVVIGVIDTGIDYTHNDLIPNVWANPSEIPGNGIDDDNNGYVDDVHGINAITNAGDPLDDNSHGTHVSGTIGAASNNGIGIAGVTQNVRIAGCKFLNAAGSGSVSDAIQCLQYFADLKSRAVNPLNIVATNNSWGGGARSNAMNDAIKAHQNLGILFVAAAGNSSSNNDGAEFYPANYRLSNMITVAATDASDHLALFSNYGKRTVDVGAPGVRIVSTVLNQNYAVYSGTSMAAPHVTGLIAEIFSHFPGIDYREARNLAITSGTPIAALQSTTISGRRIRGADVNGSGALTCSDQSVSARLLPISSTVSLPLGNSIVLSAYRATCKSPIGPITVYSDQGGSVVLEDSGNSGDAVAGDSIFGATWKPSAAGTYQLNYGDNDIVTVNVTSVAPKPTYKVSANIAYDYKTVTGTPLNVRDESVVAVSVPFAIHFADDATGFTKMHVGSNGTISFTNQTNPGYINKALPHSAASTLIAPYWDDLSPNGANSDVFVETLGAAPNREFVVEWRNMKHYSASGTGTFQAVFYEANSDVRFNYLDTDFGSPTHDIGASATVGVQTGAETATGYSFDAPNIPSLSSLLFSLH